jgi:DNA/RNA endonuclease YhcR with UshA esterase domain
MASSAKSNTYFLNFGPSREALTAVIFASTVELFERNNLKPKIFEGKEVEVQGEIKDHPQYGLELILENPTQVRILD